MPAATLPLHGRISSSRHLMTMFLSGSQRSVSRAGHLEVKDRPAWHIKGMPKKRPSEGSDPSLWSFSPAFWLWVGPERHNAHQRPSSVSPYGPKNGSA